MSTLRDAQDAFAAAGKAALTEALHLDPSNVAKGADALHAVMIATAKLLEQVAGPGRAVDAMAGALVSLNTTPADRESLLTLKAALDDALE